jgi:hypothetical protein
VLNRLVKIEQVGKLHFNHPLLEVFPQLTAEYTSLIAEPMDLRTLREQLHAHALTQASRTPSRSTAPMTQRRSRCARCLLT